MTPLGRLLHRQIEADGPITVERYMALALGHPRQGYYATRDPFGPEGDFVTAPEISQMFGELLGLWAAAVWTAMGRPAPFTLAELGPGRGTLMADALRSARIVPGFVEAARVALVETSPVLRDRQRETVRGRHPGPTWHATLAEVADGPILILANEFLDALPIRQFVRAQDGWHERLVGLGPDGDLAFGLAARRDPRIEAAGQDGDVLEVAEAGAALAAEIAARVVRDGGAALLVDYGHLRSGTGDTLQAVESHAYVDPLARPGEADLTAHVDFSLVVRQARLAGAAVHGPVTQGSLLESLGIGARAERLRARATSDQTAAIDRALRRLTGTDSQEMGTLFKAVAISHPGLVGLPGFPRPEPSAQAAPCLEAAC